MSYWWAGISLPSCHGIHDLAGRAQDRGSGVGQHRTLRNRFSCQLKVRRQMESGEERRISVSARNLPMQSAGEAP